VRAKGVVVGEEDNLFGDDGDQDPVLEARASPSVAH
jgi:hypothetical protein